MVQRVEKQLGVFMGNNTELSVKQALGHIQVFRILPERSIWPTQVLNSKVQGGCRELYRGAAFCGGSGEPAFQAQIQKSPCLTGDQIQGILSHFYLQIAVGVRLAQPGTAGFKKVAQLHTTKTGGLSQLHD